MRPKLRSAELDCELFDPILSVRRDEWLYRAPERGQTFSEFHRLEPPRISGKRKTIIIVPLLSSGSRGLPQAGKTAAFMRGFFGCEVRLGTSARIGKNLYDTRRKQYNADAVLDMLSAMVTRKTEAVLGMTEAELFQGKLKNVAGISLLRGQAALISLARKNHGPKNLNGIRIAKDAAHELGHAVGIEHCLYFRCLMNGSNSLAESDRMPLALCPVCLAKVEWAFRLDITKRFRTLIGFYKRSGWKDAAEFQKKMLASLNSVK
jgi:archaemetzincin